jgi:hypothetical protein
VLSQSGRELVQSHQVDFTTPVSTQPSVLFFDAVSGAPRPVIRTSPTQLDASLVRVGLDPSNVVYFQPGRRPIRTSARTCPRVSKRR